MPARNTPAPSNPETPLLTLIRKRIRKTGPLSIAAFMDLALNHPEYGYYHTQDPFGAEGDFVTAPEISQMFGELIGLWLATAWQGAGCPNPFRLVELGPGRGQLMADLARVAAKVPGFLDAADIHLVESSGRLRDLQRRTIPDLAVSWHDRLKTVPDGPLFLIANEFFDALPVHQLVRTEAGFTERLVSWDDEAGGGAHPRSLGAVARPHGPVRPPRAPAAGRHAVRMIRTRFPPRRRLSSTFDDDSIVHELYTERRPCASKGSTRRSSRPTRTITPSTAIGSPRSPSI